MIGHRGSPGSRPEHTLGSYQRALEQGADALEPDIVVTRDGVLIVRHENEISSTTDVVEHPEFSDRMREKVVDGVRVRGWFTEDFSWDELSSLRCRERLPQLRPNNTSLDGMFPILRLRDVLALMGESKSIIPVLELKHAAYFAERGFDLAALLVSELEAARWLGNDRRIIVESFELGVLKRLRASDLGIETVFLMESEGAPADELALDSAAASSYDEYRTDAQLTLLAQWVDGVSVAKRDLFVRDEAGQTTGVNDLVARVHDAGLYAFTWTLRPENRFLEPRFRSAGNPADWGDWEAEFGLILDTEVDGIFVDHVDLGVAAVSKFMSERGHRLDGT